MKCDNYKTGVFVIKALMPAVLVAIFCANVFATFSISTVTVDNANLVSGQSLNLDFTYSSDTAGRQIGYFVALSTQCALKSAGSGQDILVGDAGINILSQGGQVNGGRQKSCGTQCLASTAYPISGIEGGPLNLTIPLNYPTGTYYLIVAVKDWNIYLNPSVSVDAQKCIAINVTAPTPTVTRTLTPTPTGVQNVGRSPFGLTNYVAFIWGDATVSDTPTITVTRTFTTTLTRTSTPTFTSSVTATPTFTPTSTATYTRTYTPSSTQTPSSTSTNTYTPTYTATFSSTPTQTFTATPTYTATPTPSFTFTQTATMTVTPSYTPTPTATFSATQTDTSTATPTFTSTRTQTSTPTPTPTYTATPTYTETSTATDTPSATPTFTDTPFHTPTCTYTMTDTGTPTPTYTATPTYTYTATITFTATPTPTFTATPTYTFTATITFTMTATPTFTGTQTLTDSPTATPSATQSNTHTHTPTLTASPTATNTQSPTYTATFSPTHTPSFTPTQTYTATLTSTPTYTFTATPSDTMSPTITPTLPPFPYVIKIEAFNTAGEKVRLITQTKITDDLNGALMLVNGEQDTIFSPGDSQLTVRLPGVHWTGAMTGSYSDFMWDGKSDSGQDVSAGIYYIKIEVTDTYGHANTLIMQVEIIQALNDITISIYNSAGELVKSLKGSGMPPSSVQLDVDDVVMTGGMPPNNIVINYGGGNHVTWDGKNSNGAAVSSGIYEVKAEIAGTKGINTIAGKSISVLAAKGEKAISNIRIYPNPYVFTPDSPIAPATISWDFATTGRAIIKFYNYEGELVHSMDLNLASGKASWDLTGSDGNYLASGIYIVVIDALSSQGTFQREMLKFALVIKGSSDF